MVGDCNVTIGQQTRRPLVTILLVEDNAAEARLLHEVLKGAVLNRFTLSHVKRLGDAIAHLHSQPFDVILLDLTLPDSTGLDSLDTLIQCAPNLPIVVLTNTTDDDLALEAVRHGAQDYLMKRQINQDILVRSLRYAIERKQAAVALREANEILEQRVSERTTELEQANHLLKLEIEWRQRIQERLELAQQAGKIGTFEWNVQSNEVAWTAELEALYGLAPGSFEGHYDGWIQTLHPDDRPKLEQAIARSVQTGESLDTEFRIFCPNDDVRWIAVKSSLFHDQNGHPLRMIGIHMDVTEKKQLEAQFLRAQRLESLGTLASGISHDLNNILTPILAVVQLLPLRFPELSEQARRMLKTAEASAQRGAELVKQILSFARGVEGKRVSLQINHLLLEIRQIIQQTLPKSIAIHTDIPADLWAISADATQLHQVFLNLCVNARDAMPQGGILEIRAENVRLDEQDVRMHLEAIAGPYVIVTVSDTGVGIAPNILHRIFDPFFTTKEIGKGTGLGLSAVLGIAKSHGGFVDVQSEVGQGSQFRVYLPASQLNPLAVEEDMKFLLGQQECVLVVDDEAFICETTRAILELHHYRVLIANDGVEAIALFAQHRTAIHTVLMDIMMPFIDGLATLPLLRKFNPNLCAIAMSGLNSIEAVTEAEHQGFHGFLAKPFTMQELLHVLRQNSCGDRSSYSDESLFS